MKIEINGNMLFLKNIFVIIQEKIFFKVIF